MQSIYGVINGDGAHVDVSATMLGAKQYATRNGYRLVSKRVGYNAEVVSIKTNNNRWEDLPLLFIYDKHQSLKRDIRDGIII